MDLISQLWYGNILANERGEPTNLNYLGFCLKTMAMKSTNIAKHNPKHERGMVIIPIQFYKLGAERGFPDRCLCPCLQRET